MSGWLVYSDVGERMGSLRYAEDAAFLVAGRPGWTIREAANLVVWREGSEKQSAGESYDYVASVCYDRVAERIARLARQAGRRAGAAAPGPNQ